MVTVYERHESFTAFHHAVALKLFLALFLNTGLTILVVNAKITGTNIPSGLGIFSGQFTNFDPRWYSGASYQSRRAVVLVGDGGARWLLCPCGAV